MISTLQKRALKERLEEHIDQINLLYLKIENENKKEDPDYAVISSALRTIKDLGTFNLLDSL